HRDRYRRGFLAGDSLHADRTGHRGKSCTRHSAAFQPSLELLPFRTRTDESEIGEVRSLQNSLGQRFVERMAVRHHEKIGADGGAVDFGLGGIGADDLYVRWNIVGKFLFSR